MSTMSQRFTHVVLGAVLGYGLSLLAQGTVKIPPLTLSDQAGYILAVFPGQPYDPANVRNQAIDRNAYIPLVRCITPDAGGR